VEEWFGCREEAAAGWCNRARSSFATTASSSIKARGITFNILIYGYGRSCQFEKWLQILDEMENNALKPKVIYNMLIDGHCMGGTIEKAFKAFHEMSRSGISPTIATYNALLNGL
ncbi:hypothetical protein C2S51_022373, partial [Perilla frutescens var. frutescens]